MKKEIITAYEKILEINLQINFMLNNFPKEDFDEFNEKIQNFLDEKDFLIEKINSLKEFEKLTKPDEIEIYDQVNKLEQQNFQLIQEKKLYLSREINKSSKTGKALSAYKFNKETAPGIIDETD